MNRIVDEAIVLRRVNYGESDRVLTVLAKQNGKVTVFAKGARKQKSRLSGGIELLSVSELGYMEGKSDLKTLTGSRLIRHHENIVKDLDKTNQAFEALKKIDRLCDENHGQEYYQTLEIYLSTLADDTFDPKIAEVWFDLQLLRLAGVLGTIDVRLNDEESPELYDFNYEEQFFSGHAQGAFSKNDIKLMKILSRSSSPVRLQGNRPSIGGLLQVTRGLYAMNLT